MNDKLEFIANNIYRNYSTDLYFPEMLEPTYTKNELLIGKDQLGNNVRLDLREAMRMLVLGATRSGKTFLCRAMCDRLFASGHNVAILADLKNEFRTSDEPVQSKFQYLLSEYERPTPLPIKVFTPLFILNHTRRKKAYNMNRANIGFEKMTLADFMTLLSIDPRDTAKKDVLTAMFNEYQGGYISYHDIYSWLEKYEMVHSTRKGLVNSFKTLEHFEVLGNDYNFDFAEEVVNRHVPCLDIMGYEDLGRETFGYPQAYISIILRDLVGAKRRKDIEGKLFILIDELARFCPQMGEPSCKREILEANDLTAGFGINFIYSNQTAMSIPASILEQSRYIFIPSVAGETLIKQVMKEKTLWEWRPGFYNMITKEFSQMKRYQWMLIDSVEHEITRLDIYGPLSFHKETEK